MESDSGITAMEIIKGAGAILSSFLGAYLIYAIKSMSGKFKALEKDVNEQKVINQSFYEYKLNTNKRDMELQGILKEIKSDIKAIKKDFFTELRLLTKSINEINVELAGMKK